MNILFESFLNILPQGLTPGLLRHHPGVLIFEPFFGITLEGGFDFSARFHRGGWIIKECGVL